jgi:hypothetical protein
MRCLHRRDRASSRQKPNILFIMEPFSDEQPKPRKAASYMKLLRVSFHLVSLVALLALTGGCASTQSTTQNKEDMLMASGFKVITPKNATQQQKLQSLPPDKVAMIQKGKKTFYVFPDPAKNRAYVGGPAEYQAYLQLRAQNNLAQENLETAEMYQDAAMDWGGWGGWGAGWGPMGMGIGVRRF